jgi:hypothetical protein
MEILALRHQIKVLVRPSVTTGIPLQDHRQASMIAILLLAVSAVARHTPGPDAAARVANRRPQAACFLVVAARLREMRSGSPCSFRDYLCWSAYWDTRYAVLRASDT